MSKIFSHVKTNILKGIFASIPLALTTMIVFFLYNFIDKKVINIIGRFIGFKIPGLGIVLALFVLYIIGFMVGNVFGRQLVAFIENIVSRIPILKTTYQIGKQLSATLSLPEKQVFKKAVLIDFFKPGSWTVGFVTGDIVDRRTGENLIKVFIPTVPNPTTGFFVILKESQVIDPKWSIEEAMKTVVSGGIIGANEIR